MKCYCSLVNDLPKGENISITYCNCSRGFVKNFWESVLGKPVMVDLICSAISGEEECRFAIHF
ncbi:MAG: hypothetical protein QMD88_08800 [Coprothermobacterota bacterium]|nr:hypothetical protein [Coprothermobacterota bacterium]